MTIKKSPLASILWVMQTSYLETVDDILTAHFNNGRLDLEAIEAATGKPLNNERNSYTIVDGVAVIPLVGVIGKRMNIFTRISGGISTEQARADIAAALDDPMVEAIVLDVDSPGGTVDGTAELADWIRAQRGEGKKPIYTYANGSMMSGAVWIGTAADKVYSYTTAMIGSISVVMTHYDRSEQDKKFGIKRSFITSGKYKRMGNDAEPLGDEARSYLQAMVDDTNALFIEGVAANLDMDPAQVAGFAEGKIYTAAQAIELGIISGIKTLDETISAARAAARKTTYGGRHMNAQEIREKFPEAAAALIAEGTEAATSGQDEKIKAETTRLTGLYKLVHGQEAANKFEKLAAAGLSAEQAAVLTEAGLIQSASGNGNVDGANDAEQASRAAILEGLQDTGQDNPGHGAAAGDGPADFEAAVDATMSANDKLTRIHAMQATAKKYPELHKKYLDAANKK